MGMNNLAPAPSIGGSNRNRPQALVVDDEPQMVSIIDFALNTQGFECKTARNAKDAWQLFQTHHFDLLVLDVMLPDTSGITLAQKIRQNSSVPIMLLTALGAESDRVRGLEIGADDYLTKPFSPRELALRAWAIVRRTRITAPEVKIVYAAGLTINLTKQEVSLGSQRIILPDTELRLLLSLATRAPETVSARTIVREVWETDLTATSKDMIKTTIYRLRRSIEQSGGNGNHLVSERGQGYRLLLDN